MIGMMFVFTLAGAATAAWAAWAVFYASVRVGWETLLDLPPSDLSVFVAGFAAPVAALWLIVGFIHMALSVSRRQQRALRAVTRRGARVLLRIETQTRALIRTQAESRCGGVEVNSAVKDLNGQAAALAERLGVVSRRQANALWKRTNSGDVWALARVFLARASESPELPILLAKRLASDDLSLGALRAFLSRHEQVSAARGGDEVGQTAREALEDGGPLARLRVLFEEVDARVALLRILGDQPPPDGGDFAFRSTTVAATGAKTGRVGAPVPGAASVEGAVAALVVGPPPDWAAPEASPAPSEEAGGTPPPDPQREASQNLMKRFDESSRWVNGEPYTIRPGAVSVEGAVAAPAAGPPPDWAAPLVRGAAPGKEAGGSPGAAADAPIGDDGAGTPPAPAPSDPEREASQNLMRRLDESLRKINGGPLGAPDPSP